MGAFFSFCVLWITAELHRIRFHFLDIYRDIKSYTGESPIFNRFGLSNETPCFVKVIEQVTGKAVDSLFPVPF